jgi:glycosyltransferase involved in cell wall biosynthesis
LSSTSKNIIIIGPAHPLRGGLASYNERLAKAFIDKGHHCEIYTFSLQYPGFLFPGTTQFSTEPAPENVTIHVDINSVNPLNWIRVGNKLKHIKPDIIIVRYWLPFMGPCLGTILRKVKKNHHTKIVCIADNIIPHEKRIGDTAFTNYFIKPIDAFVTMSKKVLTDLQNIDASKKAQFVPHPLYDNFGEKISKQEARKKIGIPDDLKIILFFGFIRKYKGLDLLFESIKLLKEKDAIGKRYRRQDALGTPFCITVDHESLENQTVTIRYRDSMLQERIPIANIKTILDEAINWKKILNQ